jgi:uncharacterized membrane protein
MVWKKLDKSVTSTSIGASILAASIKRFDTEITEQIPGKRIAWRSIGGTDNGGVVTFHHLNSTTSRIMVQMGYEPEGLVEKAGDLMGVASRRVQGDLERFKEYLERSGTESGAWRGTVRNEAR